MVDVYLYSFMYTLWFGLISCYGWFLTWWPT